MSSNTIVGKLLNPINTVAQAFGGSNFENTVVGKILNPANAAVMAINKAITPPPLPSLDAPANSTPAQTAAATNAAVSSVSQSRGRGSTNLTGATGALTNQSNLYSAGRQLLGS